MTSPVISAESRGHVGNVWRYEDRDGRPDVYRLMPGDAGPGQLVGIYGDDFGVNSGSVSVGATPAIIRSWDTWRIWVELPSGATTGEMVVTRSDGARSSAGPTLTVRAGDAWYLRAPGGNDSADCRTEATPCLTVSGVEAKSGFGAGDQVVVLPGLYSSIRLSRAGASLTQTVSWIARPWDAQAAVVDCGTASNCVDDAAYSWIVGLKVRGGINQAVIMNSNYSGFGDADVSNSRGGQYLNIGGVGTSRGNLATYVYAHDMTNATGVGAYWNGNDMTVEYSAFDGGGAAASPLAQFFLVSGSAANLKLRRSYLAGSPQDLLYAGGGNLTDITIEENLFRGAAWHLLLIQDVHGTTRVRNNVFVAGAPALTKPALRINSGDGTIQVFNNIMYNVDEDSIQFDSGAASATVQINNNLYWDTVRLGLDCKGQLHTSLASWQSDADCGNPDAGGVQQDPAFVAPAQLDFHIPGSSPARDRGSNAQCAYVPADGTCDIGIFEYGQASQSQPPPSVTNLHRIDRR